MTASELIALLTQLNPKTRIGIVDSNGDLLTGLTIVDSLSANENSYGVEIFTLQFGYDKLPD
jgi:hypothetical protein